MPIQNVKDKKFKKIKSLALVGAGLKAYICKVTSRKIAINTILQ
jgi:hypothetical protein